MKTVSVWLILKDGQNTGKVALQKRAKKEGDKIQSFPFVFQATISGKMEAGETPKQAIKRETIEELGANFTLPQLKEFYTAEYKLKNQPAITYNFKGEIFEKELQKVKLHSGAFPQLFFIGKKDLPNIKTIEEKNANPQKDITFFKDQFTALHKLF